MTVTANNGATGNNWATPSNSTPGFTVPIPGLAAKGGAMAPSSDGVGNNLWILSSLAYELPSNTQVTEEVGLSLLSGAYVALNYYFGKGGDGLMFDVRFGAYYGFGYTVGALVHYVGKFSKSVYWRVGLGLEYFTLSASDSSGDVFSASGIFPVGELSLGFHF